MPANPNRLACLLAALLGAGTASAVDGVIPNLTYQSAEQFTPISPQLSSLHLNQPSVYNGYVIFAGNAVHEVWDIANPYAPVLKAKFESNFRSGEAESHQVTYARKPNGTAYMGTISGRGVDIWNVTTTTAPTLVGQIQLPNINYGDVTGGIWGVAWHGNYLYAGATTYGLYVIDVTNPAAPVHVATLSRAALGNVPAGPLFAVGSTLVITTPKTFRGIATVDISNPLQPRLLDSVIPTSDDSYIGGFYNGFATLITPFRAYDVTTDPSNITVLGSTNTPYGEYTSFANNKMFFGGIRGGTHGVYKYDVSNPATPVLEGRFVGRDTRWDDQFSCPIGNLIAVADDQQVDGNYVGGLIVVHETQPDATGPTVLKVFPKDGSTGQPLSGCASVSLSEWPELATVDAASFIVRPIGGAPLAGSWSTTNTILTFGPDQPLLPFTNYEIVLPAGGICDFVGNAIGSEFRSTFRTGAGSVSGFPGNGAIAAVPPTELGQSTTFSLSIPADPGTLYQWNFGNGNSATGSSVAHTYSAPGRYPVRLDAIPSGPRVDSYEAENATLTGGVAFSSSNPGFTGTGFADFPGGTGTTVSVTWNLNLTEATWVHLDFRYANGGASARPLHLVVNGGSTIPLTFASTTAWNQYRTQSAPQAFYLPAGANTIVLRATNGSAGGNIDRLDLVHLEPDEAEDADLSAGISFRTWHPGFTGSGFADYDATGSNVRIRWTIDLAAPLTLPLNFRYANGGTGDRPLNLVINGGTPVALPFPSTGLWTTYATQASSVQTFAAGIHTIDLVCNVPGSGGGNIDSLLLPARATPPASVSFTHIVHRPLTTESSSNSSPLALDATRETLWAANPDTDTVTRLRASDLVKLGEHPVGDQPENLAVAPDGKIWIANHGSSTLSVLNADGTPHATHLLPRASRPYGLVFSQDGNNAYLALQASGQIVRIDPATGSINATISLPPTADGRAANPRALALDATGTRLLVTRFISPDAGGLVHEIDTATFTVTRTYDITADPGPDTSISSRGIPNYLTGIAISPDGTRAWIPSKKDNILRGTLRDGNGLTHDQAVRSITSVIDLATHSDLPAERRDYDNLDRAHAVAFSPLGDLAFVTQPGNNLVEVVDAYTRSTLTQLPVGKIPTGILLDPVHKRLFVLNFLDRSLSAFDVDDLVNATGDSAPPLAPAASLIATESLTPQVLLGKQLFYDATSTRLNEEGYMSCASCHLDGSHDGRTWAFTGFGEGLRNTIDLRGRAGTAHGRLHWSGNFDEVHDFENQIRNFGAGTGLMENADFTTGTRAQPLGDPKAGVSPDLDALAAYVASLATIPASPHRAPDGNLTADALAGRAIYQSLNCASCHGGESYTDSATNALHDVGTLKPSSGTRLGAALTGIDTPTLRGIWDSAPYFHDGSAPDLAAVLSSGPHHDVTGTLDATETAQLIAWLQQIDGSDPAATLIPASIDFAALPAKAPVDPPFNLAATASSGLPVEFASSDPAVATIAGDLLTIQGTGTSTITATQPGNALHPAATPVAQSLFVSTLEPLFATYLTDHFTTEELADPQISGPLADRDFDGLPNLLEYALGATDPTDPTAAFPVLTSPHLPQPGPRLRITFLRRSGGSETNGSYISGDLTYQPLASANLTDWNIAPISVPNPSNLPAAPEGFEWTSYAIPDAPETANKGFIRLKVDAE
jgi:DNA-binding beta-propeller fold protein YncE